MKKLILWLLILLLLVGCSAQTAPPTAEPEPAAAPEEPIQTPLPIESEPELPVTSEPEPSVPEAEPMVEPVPVEIEPAAPKEDAEVPAVEVPDAEVPIEEAPAVEVPNERQLNWTGDALYCELSDGSRLADAYEGYLYFDADGRYTSGSAELDAAVLNLIATAAPDISDSEEALHRCYDYIRDNYKYLSMDHYAAGTTDWAQGCALTFFNMGKGNCYCWAAAVMYCARQLGFQAYVVAGWEYSTTNDHAWTMIDWSDGQTYLFDAQLEFAYIYQYSKGAIDMYRVLPAADGLYNGKPYYFP